MTQGEVTRAQMVKGFSAPKRSGISFAVYEREISVRYTVNGAEYTSEFRLPADASKAITPNLPHRGFSPAVSTERVTVYYDPKNPREAILHPGDRANAIYGMVFGGTFTLVFSMFIFVLASRLSKRRVNG